MQAAADAVDSGMVSVIGLDSEKVRALCAAATERVGADKPVQIANYLCPGNYAVSGSSEVRARARPSTQPAYSDLTTTGG